MNDSSSPSKARGRRPLRMVLMGCGIIVSMLVCALVINAAYWTIRMRPVGAASGASNDATPVAVESLPAGDATNGEALFNSEGCFACHALQPGEQGVGPSLAGVARRAAGHDDSAEAYLIESIVTPGAFVVDGYQDGLMPKGYGSRLTPQQLADLIAFLMSHS